MFAINFIVPPTNSSKGNCGLRSDESPWQLQTFQRESDVPERCPITHLDLMYKLRKTNKGTVRFLWDRPHADIFTFCAQEQRCSKHQCVAFRSPSTDRGLYVFAAMGEGVSHLQKTLGATSQDSQLEQNTPRRGLHRPCRWLSRDATVINTRPEVHH